MNPLIQALMGGGAPQGIPQGPPPGGPQGMPAMPMPPGGAGGQAGGMPPGMGGGMGLPPELEHLLLMEMLEQMGYQGLGTGGQPGIGMPMQARPASSGPMGNPATTY